jgi:hypothetical protein
MYSSMYTSACSGVHIMDGYYDQPYNCVTGDYRSIPGDGTMILILVHTCSCSIQLFSMPAAIGRLQLRIMAGVQYTIVHTTLSE